MVKLQHTLLTRPRFTSSSASLLPATALYYLFPTLPFAQLALAFEVEVDLAPDSLRCAHIFLQLLPSQRLLRTTRLLYHNRARVHDLQHFVGVDFSHRRDRVVQLYLRTVLTALTETYLAPSLPILRYLLYWTCACIDSTWYYSGPKRLARWVVTGQ